MQRATEMYECWQNGEPKSRLEIEYWDNAASHGKAFTAYIKRWFGVETERRSSQSIRIAELEALLAFPERMSERSKRSARVAIHTDLHSQEHISRQVPLVRRSSVR